MTTNYKTKNAAAVLKNVERMIIDIENGMAKRYYINDICNELSIFDWWNDWMSKSQLKDMRKFLKEAIKLGYDGYVCFKVGASGCSNGMWAYKAESTDGYSPKDCECLYKSFTPSYHYWSFSDADNNWFPAEDDNYDSLKTIKDLEAALAEYEQSKVEAENEVETEANAEITETEQVVEIETETAAVESKDTTVKVNKDRYSALRWAVAYVWKSKYVNLYETASYFTEDNTMNWMVNWSAIGNSTPAETLEFAEDLKAASTMAAALNDMNLTLDWEKEDRYLRDILAIDTEEARIKYNNLEMMIVEQLKQITDTDPASYEGLYELLSDYEV